MRCYRIVGLSLIVLLCGEGVEGTEPRQEQVRQEQENFPNLFYKLDVHRRKEAAFYLQKYEITKPQYTSEENFKGQVVLNLIAVVANQEKWVLAESRADKAAISKFLGMLQIMETPKMKECFPKFKQALLSSDSLSCQLLLETYRGKPFIQKERIEMLNACGSALHDQVQQLGCFLLSVERDE